MDTYQSIGNAVNVIFRHDQTWWNWPNLKRKKKKKNHGDLKKLLAFLQGFLEKPFHSDTEQKPWESMDSLFIGAFCGENIIIQLLISYFLLCFTFFHLEATILGQQKNFIS